MFFQRPMLSASRGARRSFIARFLWLSIFFTLLLVGLDHDSYAAKQGRLTILFTNDHHGHYLKNRDGELGMAARMTLVNEIRQEVESSGGHVLLLSGGDINTGTPESDVLDAFPDFVGMNALGYDAMALGNHEFDKDLSVLRTQERLANFPFLSANVIDRKTKKPLFDHVIRRKLGDLNVTIFGLTTKSTAFFTSKANKEAVDFQDPIEVAKRLVPKLKSEDPDLLIAITHMGHYPDKQEKGDIALARALTEGDLDFIIGGHSQRPLFEPDVQNGTVIVQAHEWGKYLGRLDIEVVNGKVSYQHQLIPINLIEKDDQQTGPKILEDDFMLELLSPFYRKAEIALAQELPFDFPFDHIINSTSVVLNGRPYVKRTGKKVELNLGQLVMHSYCRAASADFCGTFSGGLRSNIGAGEITYRDALLVLPFRNNVCRGEMSPDEAVAYFNWLAKSGKIYTYSFSGVKARVQDGKLISLRLNGFELVQSGNNNQKTHIAIPSTVSFASDCLAAKALFSGDSPVTPQFDRLDSVVDIVAFIDYLLSRGPVTQEEFDLRGPSIEIAE